MCLFILLGTHQQFIFGALKDRIEIRHTRSGDVVQLLETLEAIGGLFVGTNAFFAANPTFIWRLQIKTIDEQVPLRSSDFEIRFEIDFEI